MMNKKIRVGVIGAGAAGLCAGRNMVHSPELYEFMIFEQASEVGGTWNYTDKVEKDENDLPVHSSMYKNLKTNVPKEIMGFPDYPFPNQGKSFTHHTNVLKYLKSYANEHKLYEHIKFNTHVKSITPEETGAKRVWKILVTHLDSKSDKEYEFDSVMICNGHFAVPNIPPIPGIENYKGVQTHSHNYRDPENFRGKKVVVLGAAASGMDIAIEISLTAKHIYLSHNLPRHTCTLPSNVTQRPGIKMCHENGFTLLDDTFVEADVLLYCTGYLFNFPFLTEKCRVKIEGQRVKPLYKHLIHLEYPELCFVGLPFTVLPFPMFHFQTQYFLKTLNGTVTLPDREKMEEETEHDFKKRIVDMKMPARHAHKMGPLQWDYFQDLSNQAHFQTLPAVYRMIYDEVEEKRKHNVMWYKREEYKVLSGEEYVRSMPEP